MGGGSNEIILKVCKFINLSPLKKFLYILIPLSSWKTKKYPLFLPFASTKYPNIVSFFFFLSPWDLSSKVTSQKQLHWSDCTSARTSKVWLYHDVNYASNLLSHSFFPYFLDSQFWFRAFRPFLSVLNIGFPSRWRPSCVFLKYSFFFSFFLFFFLVFWWFVMLLMYIILSLIKVLMFRIHSFISDFTIPSEVIEKSLIALPIFNFFNGTLNLAFWQ